MTLVASARRPVLASACTSQNEQIRNTEPGCPGGERGENGAGVFKAMQFQRERGADGFALIQTGYRGMLDPGTPVIRGVSQKAPRDFNQVLFQTFTPGQRERCSSHK